MTAEEWAEWAAVYAAKRAANLAAEASAICARLVANDC